MNKLLQNFEFGLVNIAWSSYVYDVFVRTLARNGTMADVFTIRYFTE